MPTTDEKTESKTADKPVAASSPKTEKKAKKKTVLFPEYNQAVEVDNGTSVEEAFKKVDKKGKK